MPWKRETPMDQRVNLIKDWESGNYTKSQLSRRYNVSRPTIDKWLRRYAASGINGLRELSRKPVHCPHQTSAEVVAALVERKNAHPDRGPKQMIHRLRKEQPSINWPAPSTAGHWLDKLGLITPRKVRQVRAPSPNHLRSADQPNQTWCADFKGHFRMQDGRWCYPLTITDHASRYLIECRAFPSTHGDPVRQSFERAFNELGLPDVVRTDNGAPFASTGLARLSQLSVWLIRLGIHPEMIKPGRPDQNGRHERMHRTLKASVLRNPSPDLISQQLVFEEFMRDFNHDRPHTSLDMNEPASVYHPSDRVYPGHLPLVDYDSDVIVRRVRSNGTMKWKGKLVFLGEAFVGEQIALKEVDDDVWDLYLCSYVLGRLERGANRVSSL